jgi:hypothetical protein
VILEGKASGEADLVLAYRTYAGFRWPVETLCSNLNLNGIDLIASVEDPV